MNSDEIKEYLVDFQKRELPDLIDREVKISDTRKIKSLIGPRGAGKTFFMYQKINGKIVKYIPLWKMAQF